MGSAVCTPYRLAFEMLNKAEVVAGKERVYIYLDHRIEVGGTLLNPRAQMYQKEWRTGIRQCEEAGERGGMDWVWVVLESLP